MSPDTRQLTDVFSYDDIARWLKLAGRFHSGGNWGDGEGYWVRIIAHDTWDGQRIARQGDWIVQDGTEFRVEQR